MKRYRHLITMLLLIAGSANSIAQTGGKFVTSYWTKTKNSTSSKIGFCRNGDADQYSFNWGYNYYNADNDISNVKYIYRQANPKATSTLSSNVISWQGDMYGGHCKPSASSPVTVSYHTDGVVNYTAADGTEKVLSLNPKTTVKASVKGDNIYGFPDFISTVTKLPPIITVTGWNPQTVNVRQLINIGTQTVTFEWSYEDYGLLTTSGGLTPLPTLQPALPEVIEVTAKETAASQQASAHLAPMTVTMEQGQPLPETSRLSSLEGGTKTYEVTAKLRQEMIGMNAKASSNNELTFEVKYNVTYDNKLISTTYEKDYMWTEAHDNLPAASYYIVRRVRSYSSGEKLIDTFIQPAGSPVEHGALADVNGGGDFSVASEYQYNDTIRFVYHTEVIDKKNDDYTKIFYYKTGVPNLNLLSSEIRADFDGWNYRGDLSSYLALREDMVYYNPAAPQEDWYFARISRKQTSQLYYDFSHFRYRSYVRIYEIEVSFYDRILYLDGQLFDFSDYRMTYDFDFREEPATLADETPAKVFTYDLKAKYLGRDFYIALVDTVYQLPK